MQSSAPPVGSPSAAAAAVVATAVPSAPAPAPPVAPAPPPEPTASLKSGQPAERPPSPAAKDPLAPLRDQTRAVLSELSGHGLALGRVCYSGEHLRWGAEGRRLAVAISYFGLTRAYDSVPELAASAMERLQQEAQVLLRQVPAVMEELNGIPAGTRIGPDGTVHVWSQGDAARRWCRRHEKLVQQKGGAPVLELRPTFPKMVRLWARLLADFKAPAVELSPEGAEVLLARVPASVGEDLSAQLEGVAPRAYSQRLFQLATAMEQPNLTREDVQRIESELSILCGQCSKHWGLSIDTMFQALYARGSVVTGRGWVRKQFKQGTFHHPLDIKQNLSDAVARVQQLPGQEAYPEVLATFRQELEGLEQRVDALAGDFAACPTLELQGVFCIFQDRELTALVNELKGLEVQAQEALEVRRTLLGRTGRSSGQSARRKQGGRRKKGGKKARRGKRGAQRGKGGGAPGGSATRNRSARHPEPPPEASDSTPEVKTTWAEVVRGPSVAAPLAAGAAEHVTVSEPPSEATATPTAPTVTVAAVQVPPAPAPPEPILPTYIPGPNSTALWRVPRGGHPKANQAWEVPVQLSYPDLRDFIAQHWDPGTFTDDASPEGPTGAEKSAAYHFCKHARPGQTLRDYTNEALALPHNPNCWDRVMVRSFRDPTRSFKQLREGTSFGIFTLDGAKVVTYDRGPTDR